jgi:hypothetical protein
MISSTPSQASKANSNCLASFAFKVRNYKEQVLSKCKWHHYFAGSLLLIFAVSHFLMLGVQLPEQVSISTVFPFLTHWTLTLLAGILELAVAAVCLKSAGANRANWAISTFLFVIFWYRWALAYTGGANPSCGCGGILGRALHLSKAQEHALPIIVLVLLVLTIVPWLFCNLIVIAGRYLSKPAAMSGKAAVFGFLFFGCCAYGQNTLSVSGTYVVYHHIYYTASSTYALNSNDTRHVAFTCTISGQSRSIVVTNLDSKTVGFGSRTPWESVVYDGTNTYTFVPDSEAAKGYAVYTTISPGQLFVRDFDEYLDFFVIWMAYGLCPTNLPPPTDGMLELPIPWCNSRNSPFSHGFEWKITPSPDGVFASESRVCRNTNLDLSSAEEMLRPDVVGPVTLAERNHWIEQLQYRSYDYQNTSVVAVCAVKGWGQTNQIMIPMVSELSLGKRLESTDGRFGSATEPGIKAYINATNITVCRGVESLLPAVTQPTFVRDYRSRKEDPAGGGISYRTEYMLNPGDSWNDPAILHKADRSRMFFPADFGTTAASKRARFVWLLLALALVPMLVIIFRPEKKNNAENKQNI